MEEIRYWLSGKLLNLAIWLVPHRDVRLKLEAGLNVSAELLTQDDDYSIRASGRR